MGWKETMPNPSHHRGLARCKVKGKKEWLGGARAARAGRRTMSQWGGGGMHQVSGGVHLDVGVLGLLHRLSTHGIQQLVHGGGLGEKVQKTNRGNPEAEFPPQIRGPDLTLKIRVAQGAVYNSANHLGAAAQGCCLGHNASTAGAPEWWVASSI